MTTYLSIRILPTHNALRSSFAAEQKLISMEIGTLEQGTKLTLTIKTNRVVIVNGCYPVQATWSKAASA